MPKILRDHKAQQHSTLWCWDTFCVYLTVVVLLSWCCSTSYLRPGACFFLRFGPVLTDQVSLCNWLMYDICCSAFALFVGVRKLYILFNVLWNSWKGLSCMLTPVGATVAGFRLLELFSDWVYVYEQGKFKWKGFRGCLLIGVYYYYVFQMDHGPCGFPCNYASTSNWAKAKAIELLNS